MIVTLPAPTRSRSTLGAIVTLLLGVPTGCGDPPVQDPWEGLAAAPRDSAGVEIVESSVPAWSEGDRWTVRAWPEVSIELGSEGGDLTAAQPTVVGATRRSDGSVVVASRAPGRVSLYRPDGSFDRSLFDDAGGTGATTGAPGGPILGVTGLGEDSVLVVIGGEDPELRFIAPDGSLARAVPVMRSGPGGPDLDRYRPVGRLASGEAVLGPSSFALDMVELPGPATITAPLLLVETDGSVSSAPTDPASLAVFRAGAVIEAPFGARSVAAARGDRLYQAHGFTREVRVYEAGGLVRLVRRLDPPAPLTRTAWTDELERLSMLAATDPDEDLAPGRVRPPPDFEWARVPQPDRVPAASAIQIDPTGHVWLQDYVRSGALEPQHWSVFDPAGIWLGDVELTLGLEVFEIGADHVLGLITDPLGRQRVQSFPIDRPFTR